MDVRECNAEWRNIESENRFDGCRCEPDTDDMLGSYSLIRIENNGAGINKKAGTKLIVLPFEHYISVNLFLLSSTQPNQPDQA
jgi:hypothetical protein